MIVEEAKALGYQHQLARKLAFVLLWVGLSA